MKLDDFLENTSLERSLLIGFYGGGNYGDELLLEVLLNMFSQRQIQDLTIAHQQPAAYKAYHHDFGYKLANMRSFGSLLSAIRANDNIIIGGGGLWGRDVNRNIFMLSFLLWFSRFFLRKKVYLLGVGYYNSTSRLGRISAWFAGKAANFILARDDETQANFGRLNRMVAIDDDIAMSLNKLDLQRYQVDAVELEKNFNLQDKNIFVTIRRLKGDFADKVEALVGKNPDKNFVLMILEPKRVDPEGYARIQQMAERHNNVTARDFSFNPVLLYLFFAHNASKLALIGPQFHIIITAALAQVPFMPIVYDNKVQELLGRLGVGGGIGIHDIEAVDLQAFVDMYYIKGD